MAGTTTFMEITNSKTFCPNPWTTLNIDQTGTVFPCMNSSYVLGNIKKNTIQEIINGAPRKELCSTIAQGQWHDSCHLCKKNEDFGGFSVRTQARIEDEHKDKINKNLTWFTPIHLTVNWSNLCNLTCVYCNADASTAWQSVKKIPINFVRNEHDSLIQLIQEQGHNVIGLTLGGGEPLLQKGLVKMLEGLDLSKVHIIVLTNLSVDITNNEIYQLLKTCDTVEWLISFDNANKEKFEYVRHGANWDQFVANIKTMKQDNQKVTAHPAYSIYSAFELDEYYEFCNKHELNVFWCDLWNPDELDARRLPQDLRLEAAEVIDNVMFKWGDKSILGLDTLLRYRRQLIDSDYKTSLRTQEINVIDFHNKIEQELNKPTRFVDLWPKIAKYKDIK